MKKRLDMLMMERALAPSREKAKAFIMAGDVYVDGQKEDKAGTMFPETVKIEVRGNTLPYVSRGGLKLEKAMKNFDVTLDSKVCMDVGASTGGFTDCMLQNGAVKESAVKAARGISIIVPTLKSMLSPTSSNNFLASARITFSCSLNSYKIPVNGTMISG